MQGIGTQITNDGQSLQDGKFLVPQAFSFSEKLVDFGKSPGYNTSDRKGEQTHSNI
jgi:hypothetical protein